MGLIASIKEVFLKGKILSAKIDLGGNELITADYLQPAGEDSQPLIEDKVIAVSLPGSGRGAIVGVNDSFNDKVAEPGERRLYSRDPETGKIKATIHLKNTGDIDIFNENGLISLLADSTVKINDVITVLPDKSVNINGLIIGADGSLLTTSTIEGAGVKDSVTVPPGGATLGTHNHPTAPPGPLSPPTPGT